MSPSAWPPQGPQNTPNPSLRQGKHRDGGDAGRRPFPIPVHGGSGLLPPPHVPTLRAKTKVNPPANLNPASRPKTQPTTPSKFQAQLLAHLG